MGVDKLRVTGNGKWGSRNWQRHASFEFSTIQCFPHLQSSFIRCIGCRQFHQKVVWDAQHRGVVPEGSRLLVTPSSVLYAAGSPKERHEITCAIYYAVPKGVRSPNQGVTILFTIRISAKKTWEYFHKKKWETRIARLWSVGQDGAFRVWMQVSLVGDSLIACFFPWMPCRVMFFSIMILCGCPARIKLLVIMRMARLTTYESTRYLQ